MQFHLGMLKKNNQKRNCYRVEESRGSTYLTDAENALTTGPYL